LKEHLLEGSNAKYQLEETGGVNFEKRDLQTPSEKQVQGSKTLTNLAELKNGEAKKNGTKKKQPKDSNDTCNCTIF
jgi:hypothetical protein